MRRVVRAPSPRVPPVAPCAISPMPCPGMYADMPYIIARAAFDAASLFARKACIGRVVGALLDCGHVSSLRAAFSPSGCTLTPFCHARSRPSDCRCPSGRGSAGSLHSPAKHCGTPPRIGQTLSLRTCALRCAPRTPRKTKHPRSRAV